MTDRIQLNLPYQWMVLDGQPQVVLGGSVIDVPNAGLYPSATVITASVGTTVPTGSHGSSTKGGVKTR